MNKVPVQEIEVETLTHEALCKVVKLLLEWHNLTLKAEFWQDTGKQFFLQRHD